MNLRGFEQDFTNDLELFVKRPQGWEPIIPLKTWSAKKTAAPERHKVLGFENGLSPQTQIHLLDNQNTAFDIIESLLRIYLSPIEYNTSDPFTTIDVEAEQVWLFAMRWLEHYYECLMEPLAIRTEFYKHSHTKFLELMRKMLAYNPKKRITFYDALKFWYPSSTVFAIHPSNELDSSSTTDLDPLEAGGNSAEYHTPAHAAAESSLPAVTNPVECHIPALSASESVETQSAVLPLPPALPSVLSAAAPRSRLALKRPDGLAGHNKTRRHPRNSGRFPAIGNRGTRARG
jgi:serine/threonine protein kinase